MSSKMGSKTMFKNCLIFQNLATTTHCRFISILTSLLQERIYHTSLRSKSNVLQYSKNYLSTNECLYKSHDKTKFPKQKSPGSKSKPEYLFGVGPCYLALKSDRRKISKIFIRDGGVNTTRTEFEGIRKMAAKKGILIIPATRKQLLKFSQGRPAQNIVMEVSPLKFLNLEENGVKSDSEIGKQELWVALDEVQDPMNFGAILRTSFLLGVSGVIVPRRNSAPLSPVVSKASAGAMEMMHIFEVPHLPSLLKDSLKLLTAISFTEGSEWSSWLSPTLERADKGWDILGAVSPDSSEESEENPVDCTNYKMDRPAVLVLGNEGTGLRRQVLQQCTRQISIFPPSLQPSSLVGPDSLNVSVATGILVFSIMKNLVSESK